MHPMYFNMIMMEIHLAIIREAKLKAKEPFVYLLNK